MSLMQTRGDARILVDAAREQGTRWRTGDRLHDVFLRAIRDRRDAVAFELDDRTLSFADVAHRARVTARQLHDAGITAGDNVALLLDDPTDSLPAMLATSMLGAAYVPLDTGFPADRIGYICADAAVMALLTTSDLQASAQATAGVPVLAVERGNADVPDLPLLAPAQEDEPAYVIYTSGTTGRPKGVAVAHSSICNFLQVADEVYGYRAQDRVYQGMTVAFDFSVEESWVPWLAGATLVPRPRGGALVGDDLTTFLRERRITAVCCVPTLLSTLDESALEHLRLVIVSGEACPQDLVTRWHRPHRRMLNVYGPTEATVTATWTELHPDRPVTLGLPLPTYTTMLLDPESAALAGPDEAGEIGIAGPGLALGYLNREDLTSRAFIADFLHLPDNPSQRIYRTGDLGAVTEDGELAYLGRIDTQVKVRGYRIELTEIESVLLTVPGVAAAVVDTWHPTADSTELVAFYTERAGGPVVDEDAAVAQLRELLPPYMVPGWYQRLERIPLTTSDKVDRRALPVPDGTRRVSGTHVAPRPGTEQTLATCLAATLGLPEVSATADFFTDLGANSLLLSRFCAAARDEGRPLSIRDVYRDRTVRALAATVDTASRSDATLVTPDGATHPGRVPHRATNRAYVLTGVAQVAVLLAYVWTMSAAAAVGYEVLDAAGSGTGAWLLGLVGLAVAAVAVNALLPIALKWLLIGRWCPGEIELWTPRYLRFWIVRTSVRASIAGLFVGTALHNAYLRALGARIGPRALILTRHLPICTDLIEIGADAVVGREALLAGYAAQSGRLHLGRVRVGARAWIGENSVLDVDTVIGDDAELAHASALLRGGRVPAGEVWHGSPAVPAPAGTSYRGAARPAAGPSHRRSRVTGQVIAQVAGVLIAAVVALGLDAGLFDPADHAGPAVAVLLVAAMSAALLLALVLGSLVAAVLVPRLLRRYLQPGRDYPILGRHRWLLRMLDLAGNRPFLVTLFGDSSLITGYQRRVGWELGQVQQTGSNFGTTHRQDVPHLTGVGTGTMISDGLSVANVDWSSTSFRLARVDVGANAFLGNRIVYPSGAAVGDNVLLATKVLLPVDGPVHHDVGLLGSPAFCIPRATGQDHVLALPPQLLAERLRAKRRHNLATMALLLTVRWLEVMLLAGIGIVAAHLYPRLGASAVALGIVAAVPASILLLTAAERAVRRWRRLAPMTCLVSDEAFWRHERLWKLLTPYLAVLDGTPLKSIALRLAGVRVGRRLFDDGCAMPEHTLVRIGDDCTLGSHSTIQCHSLEDGRFTSDHVRLGDGVSLGTGSFVHYGVQLGDEVVIAPDAFVMKGSRAVDGSHWLGNPAVPGP